MNYGCCLISESNDNTVIDLDASVKNFPIVSLPLPTEGTIIFKEATPLSDQGSINSCVANATGDAFEILMGLEGKAVQQISRLFIYWNARLQNKTTDQDKGSFISLAMQGLVDYGVCRESTWDYNHSLVFSQPNLIAYKEGDDNRAKNFYKIRTEGDDMLNDIIASLQAQHPVVFGVPVGQDFEDYTGEEKIFDAPVKSLGNHALMIVGADVEKKNFLIRNSWGDGWGLDGHCWFSAEYLTTAAQDLHVVTKMDDLLV